MRKAAERLLPLSVALLVACVPLRYSYYQPESPGEVRNGTLCTFGVRDQRVLRLADGVVIWVAGGDPAATTLTVNVQLWIMQGRRVQLMAPEFVVTPRPGTTSYRVAPPEVETTCYAGSVACRSRLAPTEALSGETLGGSGLFPSPQPRMYEMKLSVPASGIEAFTIVFPPLLVDGERRSIEPIVFQRVSEVVTQGLCQ